MQPAARLENWYTDEYASNEYEVYVKGEIYCNDEVSGYGLGSCCSGCLYHRSWRMRSLPGVSEMQACGAVGLSKGRRV